MVEDDEEEIIDQKERLRKRNKYKTNLKKTEGLKRGKKQEEL